MVVDREGWNSEVIGKFPKNLDSEIPSLPFGGGERLDLTQLVLIHAIYTYTIYIYIHIYIYIYIMYSYIHIHNNM